MVQCALEAGGDASGLEGTDMDNRKKARLDSIKTRREFYTQFDDVLQRTYAELRGEQRLEYELNLPKTYVVEFHPSAKDTGEGALVKALRDISERDHGLVRETSDPSLVHLAVPEVDFIVDSYDARFLLFHTLSSSQEADGYLFGKLTRYDRRFDAAWFTVTFLEGLSSYGLVEGWESRFNPMIDPERQKRTDYVREGIFLALEEPDAWAKYEKLRDDSLFSQLPLETIRLRRYTSEYVGRGRVKSNGKITARGNSFQQYLNIVLDIQKAYAAEVRRVEDIHRLHWEAGDRGALLTGHPFGVKFSRPVSLTALLDDMFSCGLPFRLFGSPERIKDGYYRVNAVDIHSATRLLFEISSSFIRIYLPETACGNSLLRVARSLQHRWDSRLVVQGNAGA